MLFIALLLFGFFALYAFVGFLSMFDTPHKHKADWDVKNGNR